jgi:chitinase
MHSLRACVLLALGVIACGGEYDDVAIVSNAPGTREEGQGRGAAELASSSHTRCAWIGQDTYAKGLQTYEEQADFFDAIHPKWYELSPDGTIRTFANANDPRVRAAAAAHRALLMPMIADRKVEGLRAMLEDADARTAHIDKLVALTVSNEYDGLDIDYEHLWRASDRPGYEAFMSELTTRMHAVGKQVSVAVPGLVGPRKQTAYEYVFLARTVDLVHIMGYDFHTVGTHSGPIAPLGWLEEVVAYASSINASKFALAMPNYGVTPTWYGDSQAAEQACVTVDRAVTTHMEKCVLGQYASGRAPNCKNAKGDTIFFEDLASLAEKVALARDAGLAGVSYWTVGGEPRGFFDMVRRSF